MALLPQLSAIATADARRPGLTRVWPRAHSASAALTYAFLAVALVVALANFVVLLADYRNLFVHPDYHQAILKESLRSGLAIGPQDVVNSLQLRAEGESRPRFLAYFIQAIDQKLRLALYEWLPVHLTLAPVAWFLQGIV